MPTFYALMGGRSPDNWAHISPEEAEARQSTLLVDVTGFGSYGPVDEYETAWRALVGPLLPMPGAVFSSYECTRSVGAWESVRVFNFSRHDDRPDLFLVSYEAEAEFPFERFLARGLRLEFDGNWIGLTFDASNYQVLDLESFRVYAAKEGEVEAPAFWADLVQCAEK